MKPQLTENLKNLEKTLSFLTILFLPTQLGKHFWPESSFIYSLRIDYLSPTIYFWDLLVLGLLGVWGGLGILERFREGRVTINLKFLTLFLLFILTQVPSLYGAGNTEASFVRLKDYLIAGLFGLYAASMDFSRVRNYLFSGLFMSVVFVCFLSFAQFFLGRSAGFWILGEREFSVSAPLIAKFSFYDQIFLRPYATFSHPNLLAAFLVLSLPLLLFGLKKYNRTLKLLIGFISAGSILITFSRPAIILSAVWSVFLFARQWKLFLIFIVLFTPLIFVRFTSVFTYDSLAILRRQELSEYAVSIFFQSPLFGVGLNNFINSLSLDRVLVGTSRFLQPVHNIFLLTLAETGMLGLLGTLGLLGMAVWENLKNTDRFSKVLLGNLFMIIFLGFFDHYFLTLPQGQRLLFLILGLSFLKR